MYFNMTSFKKDNLNSDLIDGKAHEALIITSVRTLKQGNEKCGREEVSNLVNDSLYNELFKDHFNKTLDGVIESQSVKCNIISSRECLSLHKYSGLHHCSVQSTQDVSSVRVHLTPCLLLDSETNEKVYLSKRNLKHLKFKQ